MEITSESARWRDDAREEQPSQQPMRQSAKPIDRRRPSNDQKRVRREMQRRTAACDSSCVACGCVGRAVTASGSPACGSCGSLSVTATRFQSPVATADGKVLINQGDQIRTPTGQTITVNKVRRHETSGDHYYLDTDAGTSVVPYSTAFDMVSQSGNQSQEALPGTGVPGGNSNNMPFNPQAGGEAGSTETPTQCPSCGRKGTLNRKGGKYQCSSCGASANPTGGAGMNFSDSTQQIRSSINDPRSAIARHASTVLIDQKETL